MKKGEEEEERRKEGGKQPLEQSPPGCPSGPVAAMPAVEAARGGEGRQRQSPAERQPLVRGVADEEKDFQQRGAPRPAAEPGAASPGLGLPPGGCPRPPAPRCGAARRRLPRPCGCGAAGRLAELRTRPPINQ